MFTDDNRKLLLAFWLNAGHVAAEKCFNRSQNFLHCIAVDLVDEIIWNVFERSSSSDIGSKEFPFVLGLRDALCSSELLLCH